MTILCEATPCHRRPRLAALAAAWLLAACGGDGGDFAAPPSAKFTALGIPAGYESSQATAVSADGGAVAITAGTSAGARQAFRWTATEGPIGVGYMAGGTYSTAAAIAADGSVVLGNGDSTAAPATPAGLFRWSVQTGAVRLASPNGSYLCTGTGMSGDGAVVAGSCLTAHGNEAFRWSGDAGPVGLGVFGGGTGATSSAAAVSRDGRTIAGTGNPLLSGALFWDQTGTATLLGKLPGDSTAFGSAVSRDGALVVGRSLDAGNVSRGFRWTQAIGMVSLGAAPAGVNSSVAEGVAGDGTRIVGWGTTAGGNVALLWDAANGWRTLAAALLADHHTGLAGWQLLRATAISDDGRAIVGFGVNPLGQTEGWRVQLPE